MGLLYPDTLRRSGKPPVAVCLLLHVFVMVCVGFGLLADGAGHCFNCEETIMDCDMDRQICRSRCEKKVPCETEDSYCSVTTWSPSGNATDSEGRTQLSATLLCYEIAVPLRESDITTHFCGTVDEEGWFPDHSCICTHDYCNDAIYLPGSKQPDFPTSGVSGSTAKPTRPDLEQKTPSVKPSTKEVNDADGGGGKGINVAQLVGIIGGLLALVAITTVGIAVAYTYVKRRKNDRKVNPPTSNTESTSLDLTTEDSDVKVIGQDTPPESPVHMRGNYLPITLSNVIGRGRFGAVWKADMKHGDEHTEMSVAVKIFHEVDSGSWNVEKELFTDATVMLKHDNVVEFIAAEVRQGSYDSQRQFWLVTRYYQKGCLYQYLKHHTVSWQELCRLAGTTARGVAHLHADVYGPAGLHKIPVAHRDLKSSNVLVKDDGTCAVADFGLAIHLDPTLSIDQLANSGQAGTPRYMSPEALESKVNLHDVESFKQMDVYSLGLIVWEIAARCHVSNVSAAEEHRTPFSDIIPGRASVDDMKTVVAMHKERPVIPPSWHENTGMQLVAGTVEDCWDGDPEARLTAHCVEARFTELITWAEGEQNPGHNETHTITVV
ncbi:activin receptor type-2A-like [Asterias amurensis]|uniref:activin receptor type-2A-like n=1 Tax=Asterias amurensis TaxID=7602 RepID=UPI003AB24105